MNVHRCCKILARNSIILSALFTVAVFCMIFRFSLQLRLTTSRGLAHVDVGSNPGYYADSANHYITGQLSNTVRDAAVIRNDVEWNTHKSIQDMHTGHDDALVDPTVLSDVTKYLSDYNHTVSMIFIYVENIFE